MRLDLLSDVATPVLACVLGACVSLYLAPILIRAAERYGIVDEPQPPLKLHDRPVAYLGGLVIFVSFLLSLAVTLPFDGRVLAILLSASLVVAVGLVDDLGKLIPRDKLVGQLIAAIVLVKAGVKIDIAIVPFPVDEALSVLWLVTCMNAFNILDVSDGLATTAGIVGSAGALLVAVLNGEPMIAAMSACLLGACIGFLRVNREPARMYLGDTGSMLLGCVLGALAMIGDYSAQNDVSAFFVPLTLLGVPLFDLVLVVVARLLKGQPIYHGSPDHFAIRLKRHGMRARSVARLAGAVGALTIGAGVASTFLPDTGAILFAGATVALAVAAIVLLLARFSPEPKPQAAAKPATPDGASVAPAPERSVR